MLLALTGCALLPREPAPQPAPEPPPSARATPPLEPAVPPEPEAPSPPPEPEALLLLGLATQVIASNSPEERREIVQVEQTRFDADPSYDNLLRLTIVKAYSAALPAELQAVHQDLQTLANGRRELTDDQRRVALITLLMVDERLRMGEQILGLQQQIDELTEIEASLNHEAPAGAAVEESP